jgi:hypothetical protein
MNESLYKYGTIDNVYLTNLDKEIINVSNGRNRRLEEIQEGFTDLRLENTFKSLKASSQLVKQEIQTLDLFSNFEDKINKYMNTIKEQYEISKNAIKDRKYTEEISKNLYQRLEELKELSISYYNKVKIKYDKIKEYLEDSIIKIDELIEKSSNITYTTINDKYKEIKNNFKQINNKIVNSDKIEPITNSSQNSQIEIVISEMILNNEFLFDIILEDSKYKLKGQSINKNRPKSIFIHFSSIIDSCPYKEKEMTINLNNISSIVDLEFDSSSLKTFITKKYNFTEYFIDNKFYNGTQEIHFVSFGGISVKKYVCKKELVEAPLGEKEREIVPTKSGTVIELL